MNAPVRIVALLIFLLLPAPVLSETSWPDPPEHEATDPETMSLLRAGEILVRTLKENRSGGAARVQALFHGDVESLWAILGSCEANFQFVPGLRRCEVKDETPTSAVTEMSVKALWFAPALKYRFETRREPFRWIQIRLLDGDLKSLKGNWRFDVLSDEAILVTHEIELRPSMPAPSWLIRRTLRRDLPEMIGCLRWQARAWPEPRQRGRDQAKCPS